MHFLHFQFFSLFWMRIPRLLVIVFAFIYCCITVEYYSSRFQVQGVTLLSALNTRQKHPSYYNWDDGVGWNTKEP